MLFDIWAADKRQQRGARAAFPEPGNLVRVPPGKGVEVRHNYVVDHRVFVELIERACLLDYDQAGVQVQEISQSLAEPGVTLHE